MRTALATLLLLTLSLTAAADKLPTRRGPLTPRELRSIVKAERATTVRRFRAAAKRYQAHKRLGIPWRSTKYQAVAKGGIVTLTDGHSSAVAFEDQVTVHAQGLRRERGSSTDTELTLTFRPRQRAGRAGEVSISEVRAATSANGTKRSTVRFYNGLRWDYTIHMDQSRSGKSFLYRPGQRKPVVQP